MLDGESSAYHLDAHNALIVDLRGALPQMRSVDSQQAFGRVLDLLVTERHAGRTGSLLSSPSQTGDAFRRAVRSMTRDDRDEVTDTIVLAIVFALAGDTEKAQGYLEALPIDCSPSRASVSRESFRARLGRLRRTLAHPT